MRFAPIGRKSNARNSRYECFRFGGTWPHAAGSFVLIVSNDIVQEYLGVLRRPKFHLTPEIIDPIMAQIFRQAEFVTPDFGIRIIESDPSDNKFLEAALSGQAEYLVSGDKHLLELKFYQGVRIITAREFLSTLEQEL